MRNKRIFLNKLAIYAGTAAMLTLTGCLRTPAPLPDYGHPAQTRYLCLAAGRPVQTLDNKTYIPLQDEKWVNPDVLKDKDGLILMLKNALEREQLLNRELTGKVAAK